jgi:long-chain acyl-CoA synthetase
MSCNAETDARKAGIGAAGRTGHAGPADRPEAGSPRKLLLTGGTGVLGRVLIREVLQHSDTRILAVVRRSRGAEPEGRLRAILHDEGVGDEIGRRVTVIGGNIGVADLGLAPEQVVDLRRDVDSFLHLAALTDLAGSREDLFRVNVEGTRRVLELAWDLYRRGRLSRFGYFSTAFVAGSRQDWRALEDEVCPRPAWANAYEESKYTAESLVREAIDAGLPAVILRPSIVVGDTRTGKAGAFNVIYPFFRLVASGVLPAVPGRPTDVLQIVPVDFVARAAWAIFRQPECLGHAYHLTSPNPPNLELVLRLRRAFAPDAPVLRLIPPERLEAEPLRPHVRKAIEAIKPHIGYVIHDLAFDTRNTEQALEGTGIELPDTGYDFMHRIIQYATNAGFFQ